MYDYSMAKYSGSHSKIDVICPIHGNFTQTPHNAMSNDFCGCPKCAVERTANKRRISFDEFVSRANTIHNNKYTYVNEKYRIIGNKAAIICPAHGEFFQDITSHLSGQGCPKCQNNYRLDRSEFVKRAKEIHYNKYDYSKVEYKNNRTKVCIICPEHGEFWQTPKIHLRGFGCKKCSNNYLDKDLFIEKAREIHGDKYDYSKVEYINGKTEVCITCPEHGEFWQIPNSHLSGRGCPLCKTSHLERDLELFLNENHINHIYQYRDKSIFLKQNIDFYIPSIKLAIECQGEQHVIANFFKSKGIEYAEKHLEYIKELDRKKKQICDENGIELVYYVDKKIKHYFENYLGKVFYEKQDLLDYINSKKKDNNKHPL